MEEENKQPKPKGGFRDGAGRKKKFDVEMQSFTVKIRKDYLKIINENFPNRSDFVQRAIKDKLRRECLI